MRARPCYAPIYVLYKPAGGEETVYKRAHGRWRYVTGGSGWTGAPPVEKLV